MKLLLGTKQYMTQVFDEDGRVQPATVIEVGPMTVTQVKTKDRDGYAALQLGFGERKEKRIAKSVRGHVAAGMKAANRVLPFRYLREVRKDDIAADTKIGDVSSMADIFTVGEKVAVSAISKGKGFQGVVKRHGFAGGPRTHGQKHSERAPGSIGAGGVQKVIKGTRMGGRMGSDRVTVKNLTVLSIDPEQQLLVVKGAIPGRQGTLVEVRA